MSGGWYRHQRNCQHFTGYLIHRRLSYYRVVNGFIEETVIAMISKKDNLSESSFSTQSDRPLKALHLLPICLLVLGGGLVSCSNVAQIGNSAINIGDHVGNVTKIGDLKPNPNAATQVYLQGKVINQAPFLKAGAYQLQDATGKIWIVTNQTLPNVGDTLVIQGKLQFKSIPLGGQELGEVYVEEQKKL